MVTLELSGYVQIAVGIAGIIVTLLAAPSFLDGISKIKAGTGLPPEFDGLGGAIRVFCIVSVLSVLLFLVAVGLSITLSTLTVATGAKHPYLTSSFLIAALFSYATTVTLVAFKQPLWLAGFVWSSWIAVAALVAAVAEDFSLMILLSIPFLMGFVLTAAAALSQSNR